MKLLRDLEIGGGTILILVAVVAIAAAWLWFRTLRGGG